MREVFLCCNTGKVCCIIVITNWRHEPHINESDNFYQQLIYDLIYLPANEKKKWSLEYQFESFIQITGVITFVYDTVWLKRG